MRFIVSILFQLYWKIPKRFKAKCLYKESCSRKVYRVLNEEGMKKALIMLGHRINTCRPGYYLIEIEDQHHLICPNHYVINNEELADWVIIKE